MITNKKDYKFYLKEDAKYYFENKTKFRIFVDRITKDDYTLIFKYIKYLRKEELYYNTRQKFLSKILFLLYRRKRNILGQKLGFTIPKNTCGYGLMLSHHGCIIVAGEAKIGNYVKFHGMNCVGKNGVNPEDSPVIGDGCDIGVGSMIIGKISIGKNSKIGANAIVTKSFPDNSTIIKDNILL